VAPDRIRTRRRVVSALVLGLLVTACTSGKGGTTTATTAPRPPGATSSTATTARSVPTTLEAAVAPWSLPAPLSREAAVVTDGKIVVAGGMTTGSRTTGAVYRLDPATGAVERSAPLPHPVHDVAGATPGGRPMALGGGSQAVGADVQALDPGSPVLLGRLPGPRADLVAATIGTTAYVLGGYDGLAATPTVLATDDGRSFRAIGRLALAVRYPAVATVGRTIYLFGGEAAGGDTTAIQAVDLAAGTVRVVGHLPVTVAHASAFTLGGAVWVVGGRVAGQPSRAIRRFDPTTGAVSDAGSLPTGVRDAAVAVIGDTAYLLGGESPTPTAAVVRLRVAR
jgi:hypothetical protein